VITDFDIGAQDAYLVPGILKVLDEAPPLNRVVLVQSGSDAASVSQRIPEMATYLMHEASFVKELERLGSTIRAVPPILDVKQTQQGVLGHVAGENTAFEDQIQQIARNCGVSVPTRVLTQFVSFYEGLRAGLVTSDAAYLAREAVLLPWARQVRGDSVAELLESALDTTLGAS
jgi:hypothetical protein